MLATSHALTAGVILKAVPDWRIALPLAFVSHFALDIVPHWDSMTDQNEHSQALNLVGEKNRLKLAFQAGLDVLAGFGLTFLLFRDLNPSLLAITIFFAQLPDWLEMPYYFWGINFAPSIWTKNLQHRFHARLQRPWGLVSQIIIIFFLLWLVLR